MKTFEIWSEGFAISGERGTAYQIGVQEADSFEEACDLFVKRNPKYKELYSRNLFSRPSYWGCRWFDNEQDARKSFG